MDEQQQWLALDERRLEEPVTDGPIAPALFAPEPCRVVSAPRAASGWRRARAHPLWPVVQMLLLGFLLGAALFGLLWWGA